MEKRIESNFEGFVFDSAGASFAFILLRVWLGIRTLLSGIEKFAGIEKRQVPLLDEFGDPDISGAMVNVDAKVYGFDHYHGLPDPLYNLFVKEPLMPVWLLDIYSGVLGYLLIAFGLLLLLGALPRITLLATGLLYTSLTIGLVLLNESGGIAWLATHVIMCALALALVGHNRFAVFNKR